MRICHVTSHLPPEQGASALLPVHLADWARDAGDEPTFLAHPPRMISATDGAQPAGRFAGPVVWVPDRHPGDPDARPVALSPINRARHIWRLARPAIAAADIVHTHSNGLLPSLAAWIARRMRKPVVLTLYGTEIWHYAPKRFRPDLFTAAYRSAARVTFYSAGLLDRALDHGLSREGLSVVYPPVADYFVRADQTERAAARQKLGLTERHLLLNVKRLHPLAGQRYLIEAMPAVLRAFPDTRLVFCGTGPLRAELMALAAHLGVGSNVTFAGLVDNRTVASYFAAADLFVLPSQLEACPTVAVEALACGTPVVSTDSPGGVELGRLFGDDVRVVAREHPAALAEAICAMLRDQRRTLPTTDEVLTREFRPSTVAARFSALYRDVLVPRRP
ncbi:MAG: glycosyltransferase family 4 protein [Acidobacteriota bacterium]